MTKPLQFMEEDGVDLGIVEADYNRQSGSVMKMEISPDLFENADLLNAFIIGATLLLAKWKGSDYDLDKST